MKRRKFILLSAAGISAVALPALLLQSCKLKYGSSLAIPHQLTFIWDEETMIAAGKLYQQRFPEENNERTLITLLKKDVPEGNDTSSSLEQKSILDFKADRIVLLDGWILSVTEGRQCALFSLSHTNS